MRSLKLADAALADIARARKWLRQPGAGPAAERRLQHILSAIRELRAAPCRWPYSEHEGSRERIVEGYKIVYRIDPDTGDNNTAGNVEIRRVFGPWQRSDRL
jgi:plasmid stabilization system protein ParE